MSAGSVVNVEEARSGSELAADVSAGASSITVEDPTDFQPDGGELLIGTEEKAYSAVNETSGVITLDTTLANAYLTGEVVFVLPGIVERFAHVQLEGQDEAMLARVPHGLYDRLPVGIRDENDDELELVEVDRDPGGELVVADVLDREPVVDAGFIDPDSTIPPPALTDGDPPANSPTPSLLGGVLSLFVQWLAIANADPVTYEVHLSTSSGFTPGPSTYCGETRGTLFVIRNLPGTLDPPAYGVTYFVRIIAKDADGLGPVSAEDSATPEEGMQDAIIADLIAANSILAEKLEAVLVLGSTLVAGTPNAGRVEVGIATDEAMGGMLGIHAMDTDGETLTFMVDADTGQVYLRGLLDFGTGSRLLSNDIVELLEQPTGSFQTPGLVQEAGGKTGAAGASTVSAAWPAPTVKGNLLLAVVMLQDPDGTPPTPTNPTGWGTPIVNVTNGAGRLVVWKIEDAATRSGSQAVTLGDSVDATLQLFEFHGVSVQDLAAETATGTGTSASATDGDTTTQADELWLMIVGNFDAGGAASLQESPTNGFALERQQSNVHQDGPNFLVEVAQYVYTKNVVATGAPSGGVTLDFGGDAWLVALLTFKAKATGLTTPDVNRAQLYAKQVGSVSRFHVMQENGADGAVVLGEPDEVWRLEVVERASLDVASTAAHTGGIGTVTISGLAVGDLCFWLATDSASRGMQYWTSPPVCATAGQIELARFNADSATVDPAAATHWFLVIHRG